MGRALLRDVSLIDGEHQNLVEIETSCLKHTHDFQAYGMLALKWNGLAVQNL